MNCHLFILGINLNTNSYCSLIPQIEANNLDLNIFDYDTNPNIITLDCSTNMAELQMFLNYWLDENCNTDNDWCSWSDLDLSGDVSLIDFSEFAGLWRD